MLTQENMLSVLLGTYIVKIHCLHMPLVLFIDLRNDTVLLEKRYVSCLDVL